MTSVALNLGIEGLIAAQTALDTVGHNVANANTPGYSRQSVLLTAGPTVRIGNHLVGNGVRADEIISVRDLLIDRRILVQRAAVARLGALSGGLADVEALFGEPGDGALSGQLSSFFGGLSSLSSNPADAVLRQDALRGATDLADRFHALRGGLQKLRNDAVSQIQAQVGRVNQLTGDITTLNRTIAATEIDGSQANDLRDARDEKLRALSDLIDVAVVERPDGSIDVSSRGQILVTGTTRFEVESTTSAAKGATLHVRGSDQEMRPRSGSLAGLLSYVRDALPKRMEQLDTLAHSLIHEVNKAHSTGVPASGPFQALESSHPLQDTDGDGAFDDERLADAGLPFPIQDGALVVNVTDRQTGAVETVRIPIDTGTTTVGDLVSALDAIPQLSARIGGDGTLSLRAASGYGFDFAARSFPTSGALGGAQVAVTGRFTGDAAQDLVLRPRSSGDVGSTPDLLVDVLDQNGERVATLDVGAGYVPGAELDLGNGLKVSLGLGSISGSDTFELHAVADGDTSDVLAALGLNEFFAGTDATSIAVSSRLQSDPRLLAASATGANGDGGALSGMLAVSEAPLDALGGAAPGQFVGALAAGVGFDRASADGARDTEQALHDSLVAQRDARSGVNVDQELVDMMRFQQAYQASAQFIQVVNSLSDSLLNIL
jgi:flagellar hook-associated protein FlgK